MCAAGNWLGMARARNTAEAIPEVSQEVMDNRRWYEPANVLCITAREGLERDADTLTKGIEDWSTCTTVSRSVVILQRIALTELGTVLSASC